MNEKTEGAGSEGASSKEVKYRAAELVIFAMVDRDVGFYCPEDPRGRQSIELYFDQLRRNVEEGYKKEVGDEAKDAEEIYASAHELIDRISDRLIHRHRPADPGSP